MERKKQELTTRPFCQNGSILKLIYFREEYLLVKKRVGQNVQHQKWWG